MVSADYRNQPLVHSLPHISLQGVGFHDSQHTLLATSLLNSKHLPAVCNGAPPPVVILDRELEVGHCNRDDACNNLWRVPGLGIRLTNALGFRLTNAFRV